MMNSNFMFAHFLLIVLVCFYSSDVLSSSIEVRGNKRLDSSLIISSAGLRNFQVTDGQVSASVIDNIIKRLYATQLFQEVDVHLVNDNSLKILVKENPIIENILFEGNSSITNNELAGLIDTKSLSILKRKQLSTDINHIIEEYKKQGRFNIDISVDIQSINDEKVNLVFKVKEGDKVKIKNINFQGNKNFSSEVLKKVIASKEFALLSFFSSSGYYIPDRVEYDRFALRSFYLNNGYVDFKINSAIAELDQNTAYLTFTIDEGVKYSFGNLKIESPDVEIVKLDDLYKASKIAKGNKFDVRDVNTDIATITNLLHLKNYFFAQVEPLYNTHDNFVDVVYKITNGQKVYINKVNISGNSNTLDEVIRHQIMFAEGDPYNPIEIERSKHKIFKLEFFDKVSVETRSTSEYSKIDIDIDVHEKSTGFLSFGGGYSSSNGIVGNFNIKERNIFGTGNEVSLALQKSARDFSGNIGFTRNNFLNSGISTGFNIFKKDDIRMFESSFNSFSNGVLTHIGASLNSRVDTMLRYEYTHNKIEAGSFASQAVLEQAGDNDISLVGYNVIYSTLDSILNPSSGAIFRFNQDFAGLGGNANYIRSEASAAYFKSILKDIHEDIIFQFRIRSGHVFNYTSESLKIAQKFFIGSNDIRGFAVSGIGPRDIRTRDALGGKYYITGGAQVDFPLGLPDEINIKGSLFVDMASLNGADTVNNNIVDTFSPRLSIGYGFSWVTPLGPMRLDFGLPLKKESYDLLQTIRFNVVNNF